MATQTASSTEARVDSPGAIKNWLGALRRNEIRLSLVLSLIIGALVGLAVVAFIVLTGRLAARMYPPGGPAWRRVVVPTLGSLISGFFLYRYFPFARGSGIPQTKFALFVENGIIRMRTVVGKFFCCTLSLASGIALGREGPSVQVGAGIASVIGQKLRLSPEQIKSLVPMGCSAALAAAFNTPIAAVLFSLEEIMGDLHAPVLGSVVISSATSWMVLHLILGDEPLFHVPAYKLVNPAEFGVYAILGVVGGLGSVAFVKLLLEIRVRFKKFPARTQWIQPVAGGLTVGLIGWFVPEVLGVGYDYVEKILNGNVLLGTVVLLAVLKIIATAVCYSSGNAGGIFGPSLFIGAMIGASVGGVAHSLFPAYTATPGAYALIGMGTAFAGIVRTPLTSVIMIFELTRDYSIIVPVMISNLIAFYISQRLQRVPIYEALAHQDGVHLPEAEHRHARGKTQVAQVMRVSPETLPADIPLAEAVEIARNSPAEIFPVMSAGKLIGVARRGDLLNGLDSSPRDHRLGESPALAIRVDDAQFPHLHLDHSLGLAMERMGRTGERVLPVVSRADLQVLLGIATLDDILSAMGISGMLDGQPDARFGHDSESKTHL